MGASVPIAPVTEITENDVVNVGLLCLLYNNYGDQINNQKHTDY